MVKDKFTVEPLKKHCINIKRQNDKYYAFALANNITKEFLKYIKHSIDRNENLIFNVGGRTRSGKSYGALMLCKVIAQYTGKPFTVDRSILFNESSFLSVINNAEFHEIFLVDEAEKTRVGYGSVAEAQGSIDFRRICAKKCIHNINLCGDYSQLSTNAFYKLTTLGRDIENKVTKFLVHNIEDNEQIPIGYVLIPIGDLICEDMRTNKVIGCIKCPKYDTGCQEFICQYEHKKDVNIDKISEGKPEERAVIRYEVAEKMIKEKEFLNCKNQKQRKIVVRKLAPSFSNRRFTEGELDEIVEMSRILLAESKGTVIEPDEPEPEEEPGPEMVEMSIKGEEKVGMSKVAIDTSKAVQEEVYPDQDGLKDSLKKLRSKNV